jgi:hypothetical protein
MTWFGNVPRAIRVAGTAFVLADEALELAQLVGLPDDDRPDVEVGERASPDWAATALLPPQAVAQPRLSLVVLAEAPSRRRPRIA